MITTEMLIIQSEATSRFFRESTMTVAPAGVMPVARCPRTPRGFDALGRQQCGGRTDKSVFTNAKQKAASASDTARAVWPRRGARVVCLYVALSSATVTRRYRCVKILETARDCGSATPNLLAAQCDKSAGALGAASPRHHTCQRSRPLEDTPQKPAAWTDWSSGRATFNSTCAYL
jgi:hypothetical protein